MQEILPLEGIKFGFHPLIAGSMAFEPNGCGGHKIESQNEWIIRGITAKLTGFTLFHTLNHSKTINHRL
jgi:hypothetical protein